MKYAISILRIELKKLKFEVKYNSTSEFYGMTVFGKKNLNKTIEKSKKRILEVQNAIKKLTKNKIK
jgi:hypothetical protein